MKRKSATKFHITNTLPNSLLYSTGLCFKNRLGCCFKIRHKKKKRKLKKEEEGRLREKERERICLHIAYKEIIKLAGNTKDLQYPQAAFPYWHFYVGPWIKWISHQFSFVKILLIQQLGTTVHTASPLWNFHKFVRISCLIIFSTVLWTYLCQYLLNCIPIAALHLTISLRVQL